jgi:thymidylate synthase
MKVITALNVNDAIAQALPYLCSEGVREQSRNGRVLVAREPVTTVYELPKQRVIFSPTRNANPFFHLMESLWMLAGHNDLKFPMTFNKRFKEYSDDGEIIHGAYGHRWRRALGYDQLQVIATELQSNSQSRRCVLQIWDSHQLGMDDLHVAMSGGRDVPCNTQVYFDIRGGHLNMTVCNRSNDVIWGAYGANVVHFSILQEYLARWIGVPVGTYRQMSNNFHAYLDIYDENALMKIARECEQENYYTSSMFHKTVHPFPLIDGLGDAAVQRWNLDLVRFLNNIGNRNFENSFFEKIAQPMFMAWASYKKGMPETAYAYIIDEMPECDWRTACAQWLQRRAEAKHAAS